MSNLSKKESKRSPHITLRHIKFAQPWRLKDFSVSLVCFSPEIIEVSMISYSIRIPQVFWTISNKYLPSYAGA